MNPRNSRHTPPQTNNGLPGATASKRALGAYVGLLLAILVLAFCGAGCATTEPKDPCADCPFTNRPAPVWQPPQLAPAPELPGLAAERFTEQDVRANPARFIQALVADRLALMASVLEHRHLYTSLLSAVEAGVAGGLLLPASTPAPPIGPSPPAPTTPTPSPPHSPP